jgi:hypothetical protein
VLSDVRNSPLSLISFGFQIDRAYKPKIIQQRASPMSFAIRARQVHDRPPVSDIYKRTMNRFAKQNLIRERRASDKHCPPLINHRAIQK